MDYFLGAAVACNGALNLPSRDQLSELAEYLYNEDGSLDTDKTAPFLAKAGQLACDPSFFVWTYQNTKQADPDAYTTYARYFGPDLESNYETTLDRTNSQVLAVCVGD